VLASTRLGLGAAANPAAADIGVIHRRTEFRNNIRVLDTASVERL